MTIAGRRRPLYAAAAGALLSMPISAAAASHTVTVVIEHLKFPAVPPLQPGDSIVWVNKDLFRHTVTGPGKSFDLDLPAGAKAKLTMRKAGSFAITCRYHPGMKGMIVVRAR